MRRLATCIALLAALVPLAARADTGCPAWTAPLATRAAVVDDINRFAFQAFQRAPVNDPIAPWYPVETPVTNWYLCLAAALGTAQPERVVDQPGIEAFTDSLIAGRSRFVSGMWLDRSHAGLSPRVEGELAKGLRTTPIAIAHTSISYRNRSFKPLVSWVHRNFPEMPDGSGFVDDLGLLSKGGDAELSLAFIYGLSGKALFDVRLDTWPHAVSVPFFQGKGVQGIRLDSSSARLSLYLFRGDDAAVKRLKQSMDYDTWESMRSKFVRRRVHVSASPFAFDSRRSFALVNGYESYGVKVQTPQDFYSARQQVHVSFTSRFVQFSAISGVEGVDGVPFNLTDRFSYPNARPFSTAAPMLFILEDMNTHVILAIGMNANDRATAQ